MRRELPHGKIIVTGAAGLIGSALIWVLNRCGYSDILAVDNLGTSEKWRNLVPLRFLDYLEADDFLARITTNPSGFDQVGTIFHLGACSSTTETDASYLIRNNYGYSKRICQWSLGRGARFVYASSAATYGDGSQGMNDADPQLHHLRPLNMYGYSKHLFDVHASQEGWLTHVAGLKFFNVFGPNESHKGEMRSVVHKAFHQIRETGRMTLFKSHRPDFADGHQRRDFLYVKDAVAMTLHLAATPGANGLFNVGSGAPRTWLDLANALFSSLSLPPQIDFIDMPEHLRAKYQYHTEADLTRLRASGYSNPITPLEDAVRDYVVHYLLPGRSLEP
jgi:ADP-L-glycero-D-manno-heptose 6-epimerase